MSHRIEKRDQQFSKEMAWHKLTTIVENVVPEVVFPWFINLAPVFYGEGERQARHGKWVVPISSDDGLAMGNGSPVNLESYSVRSPLDLWKLRDDVVFGTQNEVVSSGTCANRGRYFISTKLTELERLKLDDTSEVELIFNSMGSIDKSLKEQHSMSSTRIVCNNTLMLSFYGDAVKFRYRHTKNMEQAIKNDRPLMSEVAGLASVVKASFNSLIKNPCSVDRAHKIFTGLIVSPEQKEVSTRAENMIDQHISCFRDTKRGNLGASEFDVLNSWTDLKTRGYEDSKKDQWDIFESSEYGAYSAQKSRLGDLFVNDRPGLDKIEARGRGLLEIKPVAVPA